MTVFDVIYLVGLVLLFKRISATVAWWLKLDWEQEPETGDKVAGVVCAVFWPVFLFCLLVSKICKLLGVGARVINFWDEPEPIENPIAKRRRIKESAARKQMYERERAVVSQRLEVNKIESELGMELTVWSD
jgi:hypothetical protein